MCTMKAKGFNSKHKPTVYDPVLTFRLPQEHKEAIEFEAGARYLKESDILREIVREWVQRKNQEHV